MQDQFESLIAFQVFLSGRTVLQQNNFPLCFVRIEQLEFVVMTKMSETRCTRLEVAKLVTATQQCCTVVTRIKMTM